MRAADKISRHFLDQKNISRIWFNYNRENISIYLLILFKIEKQAY